MKTWLVAACCALGAAGHMGFAQAQPIGCMGANGYAAECVRSGDIPILAASSAPGKFTSRIILLADQLERNVDIKPANASYLVGSFVDLNHMDKSSPMGRLIAENLMHELQVRYWKIFEPRLMKSFLINEGGEFVLSRDVKQLRDKFNVTGVIAGTYVVSGDYTVVNARLVNIENGMVMSSAQVQIPSNWFANNLMAETTNQPMKIIGAPQ